MKWLSGNIHRVTVYIYELNVSTKRELISSSGVSSTYLCTQSFWLDGAGGVDKKFWLLDNAMSDTKRRA